MSRSTVDLILENVFGILLDTEQSIQHNDHGTFLNEKRENETAHENQYLLPKRCRFLGRKSQKITRCCESSFVITSLNKKSISLQYFMHANITTYVFTVSNVHIVQLLWWVIGMPIIKPHMTH